MSLKDIRSECTDVAALLQPYVDGELNDREQESVAEHMDSCSGCRSAVSEQTWVRATLAGVERDAAPVALRTRILAGLDDIDAERAAQEKEAEPPGWVARTWARVKDLGRGGLIMVPAGAVAAGLFFVVQQGALPGASETPASAAGYGLGSAILPGAEASLPDAKTPDPETTDPPRPATDDDALMGAIAGLQPQVDFQVQVARPRDNAGDLQLVGATLDRREAKPLGARLRYQLPGGQHLVDRQLPAGALSPRGTSYQRSGLSFHLHQNDAGQPMMFFEISGVGHVVVLEGGLGGHGSATVGPERPDYALLLKFAASL